MPWDALARVAAVILLDIILLGGLIAIPLGLSGNFIILGVAVMVGLVTKFSLISVWAVVIMAGLVVLGELIESVLGSLMARRYGASKWGMLGAFVGGIVGAIAATPIFPIIGSIIGSFLGAAVGAVLFEYIHLRKIHSSMPAGWGALLGKMLSTVIKMGIGVSITVYIVLRTH